MSNADVSQELSEEKEARQKEHMITASPRK
jgi:hypothetical protein